MNMNTTTKVRIWSAGCAGAFAAGIWMTGVAIAGFVPGGGKAASDCYLGFEVTGVTSSNGRVECVEGEACDVGGCGDNKCTFEAAVCVNQPGVAGCTPPSGGLASARAPGPFRSAVPSDLSGSACGAFVNLDVKLKRNSTKGGSRAVRPRASAAAGTSPRTDKDAFNFVCVPRTTPCPPASPSGAFVQ